MTYVLLPCPFCGAVGPAGPEVLPQPDGWMWVRCGTCGAVKKEFTRLTRQAVAAWNARHAPAAGEMELELRHLRGDLETHERGEERCPWRGSCLSKTILDDRDEARRLLQEAQEEIRALKEQIHFHIHRRAILWGEE